MNSLNFFKSAILFLFFSFCCIQASLAQFNVPRGGMNNAASRILMDKARVAVVDKLKDIRAENDSATFSYAIALSDNAGSFEMKESSQRMQNAAIGYISSKDNRPATPQEEATKYVDAGELLYAANRYKEAEFSFYAAKSIFEANYSTSHVNYFKAIANLGLLFHTMGRFTKSEAYTLQAMELREKNLGKEHPAYAASINNLAMLRKDQGQYSEAENLLKQAQTINASTIGKESLPYAICLNNEAMLLLSVGRAEQAVELMKESLSIANKTMNPASGNYHRLQINLGFLYQDLGNFSEAEKIYTDILKQKEKRYNKKHPDYAHLQNILASLYMDMGKYDEVESLLKSAASIYEAKFGINHPSYAATASNLGKYYSYMGRHEESLPQFARTVYIRENIYGKKHPLYLDATENLAIAYWQDNQMDEAIPLYSVVLEQSMEFIETYFPPMSESEKLKYWLRLRPKFERFYAMVLDKHIDHPELVTQMHTYHLATKALLLSSNAKIRNQILQSGDSVLINDYTSWLDIKENLARLYSYTKEELKEENINLDSLENASNQLERSLSQRSNAFAGGVKTERVKPEDLRKMLTPSEAIVDILRVQDFKNQKWGEVKYAALVLKKEQTLDPELVIFQNGGELEDKYYKYYRNAIRQKINDEYSYAQYWKALEPSLKGKKDLILSLDGVYNQISLATLRQDNGRFLLEEKSLRLLSNSKDYIRIAQNKNQSKTTNRNVYLVGFPDYGDPSIVDPLPGTKVELNNVQKVLNTANFKTNLLLGEQASEENLKNVNDPLILHIATHGYFLTELEDSGDERVFGIQVDKARNNPMLRSGLMMSGAAEAIQGAARPGMENSNGLFTAYEASNLNLEKTELVILSACETGLGDVVAGEGVFGLQRSFLVAGANALVMSLWRVNDEATQELMTLFMRNYIRLNDKQKAFAEAQMTVRKKYPHPYYWGAFVMIGI